MVPNQLERYPNQYCVLVSVGEKVCNDDNILGCFSMVVSCDDGDAIKSTHHK